VLEGNGVSEGVCERESSLVEENGVSEESCERENVLAEWNGVHEGRASEKEGVRRASKKNKRS
jgi:hypothetical protein